MPFLTMLLSLYTVYYVFANIGMFLWSGLITTNTQVLVKNQIPVLYYLMNFNDFLSSFVTLFHIMVVNNWFLTCNMYCAVMGRTTPRLFFISFWVVTVLIMLNLVIAFMIEIYESAQEDTDNEFKRR